MSWRQRIIIALAGFVLLVGGGAFYIAGKVETLIAENGASGAFWRRGKHRAITTPKPLRFIMNKR